MKTYEEVQAERLIAFVKSHGNECYLNNDGSLTVLSTAIQYDGDGPGVAISVTDVIPATLKACRDLLGY